jgi:hypothetical protein
MCWKSLRLLAATWGEGLVGVRVWLGRGFCWGEDLGNLDMELLSPSRVVAFSLGEDSIPLG